MSHPDFLENDKSIALEGPIPGLAAVARERAAPAALWPQIAVRMHAAQPQLPRASDAKPTVGSERVERQRLRGAGGVAAPRRRWPAALAASVCVAALTGLLLPQLGAAHFKQRLQTALAELAASQQRSTTLLDAFPGFSADPPASISVADADEPPHGPARPPQRFPTLRSEAGEWPAQSGFVHTAWHPAADAESRPHT